MVDIVVPSASPEHITATTLPALSRSLKWASLTPDRVVFVDENATRSAGALAGRLGFSVLPGPQAGSGAARNAGAATGTCDAILFMDDDIELDRNAMSIGLEAWSRNDSEALMGGLRPPAHAPDWLCAAYRDGILTQNNGYGQRGWLPSTAFGIALVIIRRDVFESLGGIPELEIWGPEDALFGARAAQRGPFRVWLEPEFSGVHHYVPTWPEWLDRRERGGRRAAEMATELAVWETQALRHAMGMEERTLRSQVKRRLCHIPWVPSTPPRNPFLARLAGAIAESRGLHRGSRHDRC